MMKKLFFLTLLAAGFFFSNHVAGQSHFSTKIGEMVNGIPTITYNQNLLKQELQSFLLSNSSISVTFSNVSIVQDGTYYLLIASNADNSINTGVGLILDGGFFYEEISSSGGGTTTVTCTGCQAGCSPLKDSDGWFCTNCVVGKSEDCVKSETVSSLAVFGNGSN